MNKDVICLETDETAIDAARKMRDEDIGFLPVCDASGKTLGVVTDRDIVLRAVAEGRCAARAEDLMTGDIISCQPEDDLSRVLELMSEHEVSRVLVTDGDSKPVGVISLGDLAQQMEDQAGEVLADVKTGVEAHH